MALARGDSTRFYGRLALVFGPLFIAGGWLAALTEVGAVLIFAGTAMLLMSALLLRTWPSAIVAAGALVITWGLPFLASVI